MTLKRWDPWSDLERLRAETQRLWDDFLEKLSASPAAAERIAYLPEVDLIETGTELRLYVAVPGFVEEDIDLVFADQNVVIRGERQSPYDDAGQVNRRIAEWRYGFFERSIPLPCRIQPQAVRASVDAGVLTVILPKV